VTPTVTSAPTVVVVKPAPVTPTVTSAPTVVVVDPAPVTPTIVVANPAPPTVSAAVVASTIVNQSRAPVSAAQDLSKNGTDPLSIPQALPIAQQTLAAPTTPRQEFVSLVTGLVYAAPELVFTLDPASHKEPPPQR
ncbi:MAG TPA: hypothetical protein HPQ04_08780, partial [Rhodospirillaceae bacterium]|nr:hypothetical protein [Rhodospirillaceae bacterium]